MICPNETLMLDGRLILFIGPNGRSAPSGAQAGYGQKLLSGSPLATGTANGLADRLAPRCADFLSSSLLPRHSPLEPFAGRLPCVTWHSVSLSDTGSSRGSNPCGCLRAYLLMSSSMALPSKKMR